MCVCVCVCDVNWLTMFYVFYFYLYFLCFNFVVVTISRYVSLCCLFVYSLFRVLLACSMSMNVEDFWAVYKFTLYISIRVSLQNQVLIIPGL